MVLEMILTMLSSIHSDRKITHVSPACAQTGRGHGGCAVRARRAFSIRSHGPDLTRVGDASPTHLTIIRTRGRSSRVLALRATEVPRAPLTDDIGHKTRKRLQ